MYVFSKAPHAPLMGSAWHDAVFGGRLLQGFRLSVAAFRHLQIQVYALTIDQHRSLIDQLLPSAIESLVAAQRFHRQKELDRLAPLACRWFVLLMDRRAECYA